MQHAHPGCQLGASQAPVSRGISPRTGDTQCPQPTRDTNTPTIEIEHATDYSAGHAGRGRQLRVIAAAQWLHATTGRIATCAHSWMTAVHWVTDLAKHGRYTPARTHGPKWGPTTVAIAQEIAALKECRPSVDYLARKLKVAERTVQYHLGMLREAGLLVYRSKGTRISGVGGRASEFERIIPAAFDEALGIRTIGEGATRRPVGAAKESRTLLGKLAKKAARKARRPRRRTPVSGRGRCTPMQGGTTGTSSAAGTHSPSESKLASGQAKSPTPKSSKRGPRTLNRVGRRYQLARELIQTVPWMQGASVPRIAWIVRHVADAGWTVLEVQAAAERLPVPARGAFRPSGLLASRLASCHLLYTTPSRRKVLVEDWQDSRRAEQDRHQDAYIPQQGPRSVAARRAWDQAFNAISGRLTADTAPTVDPGPLTLEDLTPDDIRQIRLDAITDPDLILTSIELAGEAYTRRLYTNRLVDQTLALEAINARRHVLTPAF